MEVCVFSSLLTVLCVGMYGKSTYAANCTAPVVTPASLLVEYGSPAEVNCSIPYKPQTDYKLGWESKSSQPQTENETSVVWSVDSLTNWEEPEGFQCFFTEKCQKESKVNLTIYKTPDSVTLSSDPDVWVEGNQTVLRCKIKNVGPGDKLSVIWSRRKPQEHNFTQINETTFPKFITEVKNVTETAYFSITLRREDDGAQYQCAALLNLIEHKQLLNTSDPFTITVHYKPVILQPSDVVLSAEPRGILVLNCTADANPSPHYNWTLPNNTVISNSSSTFTIHSVNKQHQGQYTCIAYNNLGQATWSVTVQIKPDVIIYIVLAVVATLLVLGLVFWRLHRNRHVGQYILRQLRSQAQRQDRPQC